MKFLTALKFIGFMTILALIYTRMQVQIIDLAYQGKDKEKQLKKLIDQNGYVTYNILTLKSANHLGVKMLSENSNMRFADAHDVTQESVYNVKNASQQAALTRKTNAFLNMMSLNTRTRGR
ncbi:MAG: hypothetical protein HQL24_01225 [Candidatus Omnitrophica bacterium]|nr:hypothetical protein [Candidatus Omnitrophota bacterium]